MTHFNHEWTDNLPQALGDRFYAQDLNDDFSYLKHLPFEAVLQGRTRGVMIPPTDSYDTSTHTLSLTGGLGVSALNIDVLDESEDFVIPPVTKSVSRLERIGFSDVVLTLPNDGSSHYIVATPTKRSLLSRAKALLSATYASRIKYDGVITIQDTAPTADQILVGLCHNDEYLLCKDFVLDQGVDTIKLHKWYGYSKITNSLVTLLKTYYSTNIEAIETIINISSVTSGSGIRDGVFRDCTININTVTNSDGIYDGTFNNCTITIGTVNGGDGIYSGTFNDCTINIGSITNGSGVKGNGIYSGIFNNCIISISTVAEVCYGIRSGTLNNCQISIDTVTNVYGIGSGGTFNNCIVSINTVGSTGNGVGGSTFNNCIISINTVSGGYGIRSGTFNNCIVSINTVSGDHAVSNSSQVILHLTRISCSAVTSLSATGGKLNVLNNTVLHTS